MVKQTETSAIKASGTNRNTLFTRQLSALYTKSTLVGEGILTDKTRVYVYPLNSIHVWFWILDGFSDVNSVVRLEDVEEGSCADVLLDPPENFLLCISENWDKLKKQLTVGLVVSLINRECKRSVSESKFTSIAHFKNNYRWPKCCTQVKIGELKYKKNQQKINKKILINKIKWWSKTK